MSLSMFYKIVHHLLSLEIAADHFVQEAMFFIAVFAYSQLTLKPDFLLIYVLQMNFTLLVPLLLLSLCTNLINALLSSFDEVEFNTTDDDEKKLLMKFHFNLMMILVLNK